MKVSLTKWGIRLKEAIQPHCLRFLLAKRGLTGSPLAFERAM